ncbi:MAG: SGNH/GDSL hydrolase family protein [Verrucomicrobia bacterium]|nr:SGNH/GDSL hydrolase family protein [Verrucomicrobiota bacterium]
MKRFLDKLKRGEQATLVALGDSNTELTWHTAGRLNWVGLLQEALFETYGRNLAVTINAGCCGGTAAGAISRLDRDVIRFQPDLVIVAFGMNDAGQAEPGLAAFSDAMRRIARTLREKCGCEILLRTTNPVVVVNQPGLPTGHTPGAEWPGLHQHLYARRTVELAKELDCPVVDHYTLWMQAENRDQRLPQPTNHLWMRMSDAIHPGALGHLYFYRELAPLFDLPLAFAWEK